MPGWRGFYNPDESDGWLRGLPLSTNVLQIVGGFAQYGEKGTFSADKKKDE